MGFIAVERLTTDAELAWLGDVYDGFFADKRGGVAGAYFDLARPYDSAGEDLLPQVLVPEQRVPELLDTVYHTNARRVAAALLGVDGTELEVWGHMISKPPRIGHETPWHQDEAYWDPSKRFNALGVWMPLDDCDESNGCMTFLPGSHLRYDVLPHRHISDDPNVHGLQLVEPVDVSSAVAVPLRAGGATFHHARMLHFTAANRSERRRRAYANEWQTPPIDAPTRADRPWIEQTFEALARRSVAPSD